MKFPVYLGNRWVTQEEWLHLNAKAGQQLVDLALQLEDFNFLGRAKERLAHHQAVLERFLAERRG